MSDRERRPTSLRAYAEHAVTEARRILAESERPEYMFQVGTVAFPVSLTLLNRDYVDDGASEAVALADCLSAILPELDRLALSAASGTWVSVPRADESAVTGMWERNRAELARMEG